MGYQPLATQNQLDVCWLDNELLAFSQTETAEDILTE